MNTSSKARKTKNLAFFLRIFSLLIFVSAITISVIFSTTYIENNSKLSIEFAGGYETQVQYNGKGTQKDVVNLLKNRVDPLGTSNVNIESITNGNGKNYKLSLSKDAGVSVEAFVHNAARSGYFYLMDKAGNDLLATKYDDKAKTWSARDKRLKLSDVFSKIIVQNNQASHRPELHFIVKDKEILTDLTAQKDSTFYIYSDIGQLLDYVRNSVEGINLLARFIDRLDPVKDVKERTGLISLLDSNTPGLGNGASVLQLAKKNSHLLDISKNGGFGIAWKYADTVDSTNILSVDTNVDTNTYDPQDRFDPSASEASKKISPMNAWLPYIYNLVRLDDISNILNQDVIDYRYTPYWVGAIKPSSDSLIAAGDEVTGLNLESAEQFQNVLSSGLSENSFTLIGNSPVAPSLGADSLEVIIIVLLVTIITLMVLIIFYYRLLGIIVLITLASFLLFTIVSFTFISGIFAPESLLALIVGFALLVDSVINLLERFKKEHGEGKTLTTAFKAVNKKTLSSSLDNSIIILIVSLVIFWFGTRAIKGFVIMTSIATFGVIVFGILLLRLLLWGMISKNWLEDKSKILGTNIYRKNNIVLNAKISEKEVTSDDKVKNDTNKKSKNKDFAPINSKFKKFINKFKITNSSIFSKSSKWILSGSAVLVIASGVTYSVIGANFASGFDSRTDFIGLATVSGSSTSIDYSVVKTAEDTINEIRPEIKKSTQFDKYFKNINYTLLAGGIRYKFNVNIETNININSQQKDDFIKFLGSITSNSKWTSNSSVSWSKPDQVVSKSGADLLINMIIAISLSFVIILIYIIIRFQLTYVLPLILAIIFGLIMTLAIISLVHIAISTTIVGVLLGVMMLIVMSVMVIFDNIREIKLNNNQTKVLTKEEIIAISNESVQKSLPRTLIINGIILLSSVVIILIIPSFWIMALSMLVGSLVSLIASYFIAPWTWSYFERWRVSRYKKRLNKIKKHFVGPDEYVVEGINE
ncbi:protein translocase subunit SecDF [Spiroplasma endosymbiont of Nebria brevicollis]|uniref:protein translocase subunit SecDF n=1 Tax=Spiroplasma endosymbiont of Nebria brevicollis TaxID=3066284 RepID=UPI00313A9673